VSVVRVVDVRAMPWNEHPGVPGGRIKVLAADAEGSPAVTLNWLPPVLAAHAPERHYHRTVVEHGYALSGELPIREYHDRDDVAGELVVFRSGYFFRRLPGSVHGVDPAPRKPGIGFLILEWRSGPGTYLWEEGAEHETVSLALPEGAVQPAAEVRAGAGGVVRDREDVTIVDTRASSWEAHPWLAGARATVLCSDAGGVPAAMLSWIGDECRSAGAAEVLRLGYVLAGRLALPGHDGMLEAECFYEPASDGAPRALDAPGALVLEWRANG
jgi:hypothetical protein